MDAVEEEAAGDAEVENNSQTMSLFQIPYASFEELGERRQGT